MKIAVNTRFLLKGKLEGIGWVSYELLQRMVAAHPEDEFIFLFDRPYDPGFVFGENVKPIVVFPPARHPLLWYWWFEWSIPRILKREKPDVFFSPDGYASLRTSCPTVMICHDIAHQHFPEQVPFVYRYYYNYFVPRFVHHVKQVIAVSDFTKKDIIREYQTPADKIEVVYNGCREGFQALSIQEQDEVRQQYTQGVPYFFYVGAVHPRKNIHRLIQAFDRFKKETGAPHQLLIGGRFAWQTGVIKSAYDQSPFREEIKLLGYLEETALFRLMAAAETFVYLSVFEGFGLPVLEAFHAEVPVITANRSSLPEVAGDAAILVEPEKVEAIAEAMKQIASNPQLRAALIAKGRVQREKFSWERAAKKVYQLLQKNKKP